MSARDRKNEDLAKYLPRLLLAMVRQAGGEVRIPESEIDIDTTHVLVRDFDPKTQEIILRASTRYCEFLKVEPEATNWVKPMEERMLELVTQGREPDQRHHIPTDADLIEAEQRAATRARVSRVRAQPPIMPSPTG